MGRFKTLLVAVVGSIALCGVASGASYTQLADLNGGGITLTVSDIELDGNNAYYSLNGGASWTLLANPAGYSVTAIAASHGDLLDFGLDTGGDGSVVVLASSGGAALNYLELIGSGPYYGRLDVNWNATSHWNVATAAGDGMAPVPIPGAALLLGSGLAGVAVVGRRRLRREP